MTTHLLALSIGPVQDFIAAARRTRDLWFGSHLLSEISKAAARAVHEAKGQLIFPAPDNPAELDEDSDLNVANVILAELPDDLTPNRARKAAYDAAQASWTTYAQTAKDEASPLLNETLWNAQVEDVLEFYAAWTAISPTYKEARERVMLLLAGRKACRNFRTANGQALVPKSSLDGARETVLIYGKTHHETRTLRNNFFQQNPKLAQRLRLSAGEELDIIGFTKRAATKEPFPSVTRVAADPWIRGIAQQQDKALALLKDIENKCRDSGFATGTGNYYRGYRDIFPYDGAILYPARLASMLRPAAQHSDDFEASLSEEDKVTLRTVKTLLDCLQKRSALDLGEPDPYLAVLVADGDRMGKTLSEINSVKEHRTFSRQLAQFAGEAHAVVKSHHGCLVYSGGDDVLAFVPVDQCLRCARQLHERFGQLTEHWKDANGHSPTLSVGIAIAHSLDPLEDLLSYGRAAERAAKEDPKRNGLAVHLHPRSGAPIRLRARWTDENALDTRLEQWATLHLKNLIPDKAAYDLRELIRDYDGWPTATDTQRQTLVEALRRDAIQMLKQKRGRKGDEGLDQMEELLKNIKSLTDAHRVAEEILVARRIADVRKQAERLP